MAMEQVHTLTIEQAARLLGVSRSAAYEVARSGELTAGVRVIRVGHRMLVPRIDIEQLLGPVATN
jgi:excisionase family DNA binding protein